jgi:hypothetical protein
LFSRFLPGGYVWKSDNAVCDVSKIIEEWLIRKMIDENGKREEED